MCDGSYRARCCVELCFDVADDYEGYSEVKRKVGQYNLFTCGEHEYTRYGFRQLLEKKCCDILQPDITWCGGITEARRIYALASAYDVPCIPHGSSVYSYHLQFACAQSPLAELLIMSPNADKIVPYFGNLFTDEPLPVDGYIDLDPTKPGFGVTSNIFIGSKKTCLGFFERCDSIEDIQSVIN